MLYILLESDQMWSKVDHARQNVFVDYVFENMTPSQTKQAFVSVLYILTKSFPIDLHKYVKLE
jgi:hypothetical protein